MKSTRSLVIALLVVFAFAFPGNSCGPFFAEAVFVLPYGPDGPYANYAKGQLGVPQSGYRVRHLVIAYDWLNGAGLSADEQQQAERVDTLFNKNDASADPAHPDPGFDAWVAARKDSGIPPVPLPRPAPGSFGSDRLNGDRPIPGGSYESFANCLDPAFATAAQTLAKRKTAHAGDAAAFADWVHGQDAVFANCNGDADAMPADTPAGAPAWLRQDRAYQQAAAKFYQTDYDGAITRLHAIATDNDSPWHTIAPLVAARALIRRATIGQITELPPDAVQQRGANYSEAREKAQQAYAALLKQKRPQRFTEARDALRAIVAQPSLAADHTDAGHLLDFVMLRLDPDAQAKTLTTRLTASNRPQTPGVFAQALIDLSFLLNRPSSATDAPDTNASKPAAASDLIAWIDAMHQSGGIDSDGDGSGAAAAAQASAAKNATDAWQATHATPWLIAALTATRQRDPAAPELLHAAASVARDSPAWTAATYYRLRASVNVPATRTDIGTLLPSLQGHASRSTINLFRMLQQNSSPTLDAFLKDAGTLPAGITLDSDDADAPDTKPSPEGLCNVNTSQAETLLFDQDAATVLNTRMPLPLLAQAAASTTLPRNLAFQIAQSTWTRAVLLDLPAIAKGMSPLLIGCYPAWKPWLDAYDTAGNDDRRITGLLALMRFASTEPIVRAGMQRDGGFATYSAYRDNWWSESRDAVPSESTHTVLMPANFFGSMPATRAELPDPPFLTSTDRAAAEREVAALRAVPCASDYFAKAALDWQNQHPADPRAITALGFAERVVRNGCRTDATRELNHQLFIAVQSKYPKSEWATKYNTWE